jgi:hypothetical protein
MATDYLERQRIAQRDAGAAALRLARERGLDDNETALLVYDAARDATVTPSAPAPWHCDLCGASEAAGDDWRTHDCMGALSLSSP